MKPIPNKLFKVAALSSNLNSFGLRGMVVVADDGEAWEVGGNSLNVRPRGAVVSVPMVRRKPNFSKLGYEIPRKLPKAPPEVVAKLWPN